MKDNKRLALIRTEPIPKELLEKYLKADENPNQQLDWSDVYQRYCKRHDRSYHIKCRYCHKQDGDSV